MRCLIPSIILICGFLFLMPGAESEATRKRLHVDSLGLVLFVGAIVGLMYGMTLIANDPSQAFSPLVWAMFADVVDFSEWKTGRRATGIIYATIIFGLKAGLSLGGATAGWLLSGFGYRANAVQTPGALLGIRMTISVFPAILFLVVVVCLVVYPIGKQLNIRIQDELAERRKKFGVMEASHING